MKAGSKTVSKEATLEPRNVGAMEPTVQVKSLVQTLLRAQQG